MIFAIGSSYVLVNWFAKKVEIDKFQWYIIYTGVIFLVALMSTVYLLPEGIGK
jgi:hypothetical protein